MARLFKITLSLFLLVGLIDLQAKTIVVEPNNQNKTLKIAFKKAVDGDTVLIRPGLYQEGELHVNTAITIIGQSYPEIDGQGKFENLRIEKDGVHIEGILFSNSGRSNFNDIAALKIQNVKHVLVKNCRFKNNFFAIHTTNSSYISYIGNDLLSERIKGKPSANGIHIWKAKHMTIEGNSIRGHRDGIYLEFVEKSHIENNQSIDNSRYGMHFMFSHDNLFQNNIFKKNDAGVAVMYSKRVKMLNNTFKDSWGNAAYGLLLKEIDDSQVIGNTFSDNTTGIYGDGANRVVIQRNEFLKNGWALKINASSVDASVSNNNFRSNTFDLATNGNLRMKTMDGNYWDKYEGYDLDKNRIGDVPHRPISLYAMIVEKHPMSMLLFRSFMVTLLDRTERMLPSLTPENLKDDTPSMKPLVL